MGVVRHGVQRCSAVVCTGSLNAVDAGGRRIIGEDEIFEEKRP